MLCKNAKDFKFNNVWEAQIKVDYGKVRLGQVQTDQG